MASYRDDDIFGADTQAGPAAAPAYRDADIFGGAEASPPAVRRRSSPFRQAEPGGPYAAPSLVTPPMSFGESLAVGSGRMIDRLLAGGKQMLQGITGADPEPLRRQQQFTDAAYAPRQRSNPIGTSVGESLPGAIASIPFTGGASLPGVVLTGALSAAAPELLAYGSPTERLERGAKAGVGGAIGAGAGAMLARGVQPFARGAQVSDDALNAADRIGVKLTAGQRTQNPMLLNAENYLSRSPGFSGEMQARALANQQLFNRSAAHAMGENADDLSGKVFQAAKDRIGSEFDRLSNAAAPDLSSPDFFNALARVDSANRARQSFARPEIAREIDKALDLAAGGKLTGKAYQEIRSELSSASTKAYTGGDATLGDALKQIRAALDQAANASLSSADQAAYATARDQYKAYKLLTKGMVAEGGNVSPARLAGALRQDNPDAFRRGVQSPLRDIATIGESVKGALNPNSGNLGMSQAMFNNPLTYLPAAATNALAGQVLMRRPAQAWLGAGPLSPELFDLLTRAGVPAGMLGLPAYQASAQP